MKTSITIGGYARNDIKGTVEFVRQAEKLGVERVWSAEAWGQDAVTSLAFLAAQTDRIGLGTGIMQFSARVPSMIAMTSLSLQALSNGRFTLGLAGSRIGIGIDNLLISSQRCRNYKLLQKQHDLWEIEVYSETRKISNAESGAIQLTRRGYGI